MTSTNTTDLEDVDVFDFSLDALDTFDTLDTLDTLDTNTTSTITERRAYDDFTALDDIVLSSLHSLHFVLSPTTTILRVSTNCLSVLGCEPNLLLGQRLASLIHHDDARVFSSEIHDALRSPPSLPFRFHCRIRSVVAADRTHSAFELLGHYQVTPPGTLSPLQLMMPPPGIFSITARPAVTQRGHELDGMLELKVEQIRLTRRIEELQKQQVAEIGEEEASLREDDEAAVAARARTPRAGGIDAPPSSKRSRSSPPRLLADNPHPGPEGSGSPSKVEMGDAGIPFLARSRDSYSSLKSTDTERLSKRKFAVRDYRCARCGRTDSPEWRRGPDGPKTLCNACGLMYSKAKRRAEKQEQSESSKSEGREDREEEGIPMGYPPPYRKGDSP